MGILKKRLGCLTMWRVVAILCAIVSCRGVCFDQQTVSQFDAKAADESIELVEARTARASAERRVLDLELEIEQLKIESQALKSKYAELYLKTNTLLDSLKKQELAAANLLQGTGESVAQAKRDELLEALEVTLTRVAKLQETFAEYQRYVNSMTDILQASWAVRGELDRRRKEVQDALDAALKPLMTVSGRQKDPFGMRATVMKVEKTGSLVVLDKGTLSGLRAGVIWFLADKSGRIVAKLKTVEARAEYSAAVVIEGNPSAIRVGSVVSPLMQNPRK